MTTLINVPEGISVIEGTLDSVRKVVEVKVNSHRGTIVGEVNDRYVIPVTPTVDGNFEIRVAGCVPVLIFLNGSSVNYDDRKAGMHLMAKLKTRGRTVFIPGYYFLNMDCTLA